ncbi:lysophospholipase L1-like esterase [Bradyrhizobium sp. JR1.7]|uniref:SGNH/GDSL hydrolase family protein n=1 Tax=unclassified Bradyrhizobium TaxID=2631580 RepID=UPI00339365D8
MSRTLPWIIVAACLAAFVASFSELQRVRTRLGEVSRHQFHDHAEVRQFMIRSALADADQPIVVLGDSITEMAPLPRQLCGHPVINAGVGGMTIGEAAKLAQRLFANRTPFLIALALGANDIGSKSAGRDFSDLLRIAAKRSPRLVSISVTSDGETSQQISLAAIAAEAPYIEPQLPPGSKMTDGIHYTAAAYARWIPALESLIAAEIKDCR